jgi:hypothetical protein
MSRTRFQGLNFKQEIVFQYLDFIASTPGWRVRCPETAINSFQRTLLIKRLSRFSSGNWNRSVSEAWCVCNDAETQCYWVWCTAIRIIYSWFVLFLEVPWEQDCLCGLVIRVPGYRSRDPGFDCRRYQIFGEVVSLERGPLSLVSITEELLEWKSSGSGSRKSRLTVAEIRCADTHKSWH